MRFAAATLADWRGWPRNVRLFFLANLLYQFGTGLFSVLYNLYVQKLGYADSTIGSVVSVQSLATALCFLPIGLLGDRMSRRRLLVIGTLGSGILLIGRSLIEAESSLLALAVVTGLFATVFQVLAIPFLADNVAKSERLRVFSIYSAFVLASQVAGSLSGGVVSDLLQYAGVSELHSLRFVLLAGGVATLFAFLPLLTMKDSNAPRAAAPSEAVREATPLLSERNSGDLGFILKFAAVQLLIGIGSGLVVPYLNLYFTNRFAVSLSGMSLLLALGQVMTIVSMLIGPTLARRIGQVKAIVVFQTLSLPFLLLTGFTNLLAVASISFLFRQALMNAANPLVSATIMDRVAPSRQSLANSCMQTAFMLGWATMGPVQAYIVTAHGYYWGYAMTFSITGALYVTASMLIFLMFRGRRGE
ncbi:MFS transporter [Cohnella lubricantis]|uniref:MFS transporter n=1 Tax=Cohnella lubricantis TaxID=2163172 RepID=A0A841TB59_9BACL|nr:MFS transporter [Cohnella lubricantis]MBB6678534.1 MFS transporter [Cohnella lubricantis]MBP2119157.1 MFS family permease [Cohnella lubricantis]